MPVKLATREMMNSPPRERMSEQSRKDFAKVATAVFGTAMLTQQTVHATGMQNNTPPTAKPQIAATLVQTLRQTRMATW